MNIRVFGVQSLHVLPQIMPRHNHPALRPKILPPPTSNSLSSSIFLGLHQKRNNWCYLQHSELHSTNGSETDNANNGSNQVDGDMVTDSTKTSTTFLRAVDNFGMKLKPWAMNAYQRSLSYSNNAKKISSEDDGVTTVTTTTVGGEEKQQRIKRTSNFKSILCRIQSNILWMLYILYRGYRGFFVLLPAVFREVYSQLNESNLVVDVYGDEEMEEREYAVNANASPQKEQVQQPMKLRTRITISILSGILTMSYVISGALRVLGKFIKTFTTTTSFESSFEAAAEEVIDNENKLRSKLKCINLAGNIKL